MLGKVKKAVKSRAKREVKAGVKGAKAVGKLSKNMGKLWLGSQKRAASTAKSNAVKTFEGHKRRAKTAKTAASKGVSKAKAYIHKKTAPSPKIRIIRRKR